MPKPLTIRTTTNSGKFLEMSVPDHLTCLLRNLYAGQEATVRTGHGTTDWFQIGNGVHKGCIGEGNGKPLQYSRLENPMHRRAW